MFRYQLAIIVLSVFCILFSFAMPTTKNKCSREQSEREKYAIRKKQKQVRKELNRMEMNRRKKAESRKNQETSRIINE
jgi:hypothetical protein